MLAVSSFFGYFYFRNRKIIYKDREFFVYGLFGKVKKFNVGNIVFDFENSVNGTIIKFNNNEKIKIEILMTNYSVVKDLLEKNNIKVKSII